MTHLGRNGAATVRRATAVSLSICIPTHEGRAEPLRRALGSIVGQLGDVPAGAVEVVVSDNGSRDATREMVEAVRRAHPDVVTSVRFDRDEGFAANLFQAVGAARGEFCWLFSSDDALAPGGLRRVLGLLADHPGLTGMTIRPVPFDFERVQQAAPFYPAFLPPQPDRVHRWASGPETVEGCGIMMGLLPAQVVRRSSWDAALAAGRADGLERFAYFPHYYVVLRAALAEPGWLWDPGPSFLLQTGLDNSVVEDLDGDLTNYHLRTTAELVALWRELLGDGPASRDLLARTRRAIFPPRALVDAKLRPGHSLGDDVRLLRRCAIWFWRIPGFWPSLPVLLLPHPVARALLRGLHAVRPPEGR